MRDIRPQNVVVYTVIFNKYDILREPRHPNDDITYICFTDDPELDSEIWDIRILNNVSEERKRNRHIKILPHKYFSDYDYSVYVDGNIQITGDIMKLINKYLNDSLFAAPKYPHSNCIYDEYPHYNRQYESDEIEAIENQLAYYREQGFPQEFGFTENNILLRTHSDPELQELMKFWWNEYTTPDWSMRDQISFAYVVWKSDFDIQYIEEGPRTEYSYFIRYRHKPSSGSEYFWKLHTYLKENRYKGIQYLIPYYSITAVEILRREGFGPLFQRILEKAKI